MACKEGTVQPQHFVEEIDYTEIQKLEVCVTATNCRNMYWKLFLKHSIGQWLMVLLLGLRFQHAV